MSMRFKIGHVMKIRKERFKVGEHSRVPSFLLAVEMHGDRSRSLAYVKVLICQSTGCIFNDIVIPSAVNILITRWL